MSHCHHSLLVLVGKVLEASLLDESLRVDEARYSKRIPFMMKTDRFHFFHSLRKCHCQAVTTTTDTTIIVIIITTTHWGDPPLLVVLAHLLAPRQSEGARRVRSKGRG